MGDFKPWRPGLPSESQAVKIAMREARVANSLGLSALGPVFFHSLANRVSSRG